ncbi:MAG TPA: helix-turn-helix domain-containing protein [Candidatus Binatia bacterium]|nr:helix-turn-helix domain-containing protein [Candidatus Binatia bacterium]
MGVVWGRPKAELIVTEAEREHVERWARRPKTAQALRARIILRCADGKPNTRVAAGLGVTKQMVVKWRARFVAKRAAGLLDEPRPGDPRDYSRRRPLAVHARSSYAP